MYRKLTALVLALALMLGATGAQATGIVIGAPSSDAVQATEAPEADAPESDAPESDAPESDATEPDANASPLIQVTAGGNASIFPSVDGMGSADYVDSMAACGDTLYVMGSSKLYAYKAGAQEMTVLVDYNEDELLREARSAAYMTEEDLKRQEYAEDVADAARRYPSRLIGGGDALYAVNAVSGAYGPVVDGLIQPELTLQWDDMVIQESDWTMQRSVGSFVRTNRGLYAALGPNASSYSSLDYTLVRYDLTTGERTDLQVPGAQSVTAYREGKLLVVGNDENYNVSVRVFDEESGAVESTLMAQEYGRGRRHVADQLQLVRLCVRRGGGLHLLAAGRPGAAHAGWQERRDGGLCHLRRRQHGLSGHAARGRLLRGEYVHGRVRAHAGRGVPARARAAHPGRLAGRGIALLCQRKPGGAARV